MAKKTPTISDPLSPVDVANTVLQEAFRSRLRIGPKQLFAAVMEIYEARPELLATEQIIDDPFRGRSPIALVNKFDTVPLGPITRYIPDAAGGSRVIPDLAPAARAALGVAQRRRS